MYPWERYLTSISPPSARGVKQGCRLCAHAFKIMHGRKRTWMTKRKSRGPETNRYPACREHPYLGRIVKMLTVAEYNQEEEEGSTSKASTGVGLDLTNSSRRRLLFLTTEAPLPGHTAVYPAGVVFPVFGKNCQFIKNSLCVIRGIHIDETQSPHISFDQFVPG